MLEAVLDFETRSGSPLEDVGAINYAQHESTSIFCLGYQVNNDEPAIWIPERAPMPDRLWKAFQEGVLVAHNAAFERAITKYTLTRYKSLTSRQRQVLATLPPSRWRCLAAKAAMASLPRKLEGAAKAMELPTQKDMVGHKLIQKYSKPRRPTLKNPSPWWTAKKDLRAIYRYCLVDVKAERELHDALPNLSLEEQGIWELDQKINDRGVLIDIPTVKTTLKLVNEEMKAITERVQKLSDNEVEGPSKRDQLLKWVNKHGANLANLQAATIRDRLLADDLTPKARSMLEYRQSGSRTSTAKYVSMINAVGEDHRARELLLYCGAIPTARWAGRRVQIQNFPRPTIKDFNSDDAVSLIQKNDLSLLRKKYGPDKVMDVLVSAIRGMLIASPGYQLFCADFAAIEARVAFWVAQHEEGIRAFIEERKLYEEMASAAFNIPINRVSKDSLERFVGKESVLGCQYGMGWKKFQANCHQKGVKQVTEEMAKKAVYTYRKVHHPIPKFWGDIEKACIQAILHPGKKYEVTQVVAYVASHWLNIRLPSGRRLRYFHPTLSQKQLMSGKLVPEIRYWTMDFHQWKQIPTWGGTLTNHIVQGISRDLMANAMRNIERAGYSFLLSIHDEALSEHQNGNLKEYISHMVRLPLWAQGLPLTAEGWMGKRYHK